MKVLHTSDWHLGRALYGKKRYSEFQQFLEWMYDTLKDQAIDVLIVAGDIFDTSIPSNRAQQLYYEFLSHVAQTGCQHVIVVAGNHDSPSFLSAPKILLQALKVYVVGTLSPNIDDDIRVLSNNDGTASVIVCAVPYLRDRDMRIAQAGEQTQDKEQKLLHGIRERYQNVATAALSLQAAHQKETGQHAPIIATGHLFVAGGQTLEGDGVRDLYVGSLAHVSATIFSEHFDYVALGHLHVPQMVAKNPRIRYSGSPLPMGFGEAKQQKKVYVFDTEVRGDEAVHELLIPTFQRLVRIHGSLTDILQALETCIEAHDSIWVEIVYTGDDIVGDLRRRIEDKIQGSMVDVLRIKNPRMFERALTEEDQPQALEDLNVHDVFTRCLDAHEVPEQQRPELTSTYNAIVSALSDDDMQSE